MKKSPLIVIVLSILTTTWAIHFAATHLKKSGMPVRPAAANEPSAFIRSIRPRYPYSIIPGGAYSQAELQGAAITDPVVKSHYADFDTTHAKMVVLTDDTFEYVSYRLKNQVFWTKRKLRIPKGELLVTDGASWARARCGNRLSPTQHIASVSPKEPDLAILNLPSVTPKDNMPLELPTTLLNGVPGAEIPSTVAQTAATPANAIPSSLPSETFVAGGPVTINPLVPASPIVANNPSSASTGNPSPGSTGSPSSPPPTTTTQPPPSNTPPVPEPSSLGLFAVGFIFLMWLIHRTITLHERR